MMSTGNDFTDTSKNDAEFLDWFKSKGGTVHAAIGITTFPDMGRGAVAIQDIKKDTVLFTLPRSLRLSTRTSMLPSKFGEQEWKKYQLHKGWVGLILCMLWEDAAGNDSKWCNYLRSLPDSFDTPMFWNEDDLKELDGTTIYDKIGKTEAEKDYHEKVIPAIKSRPDLFLAARKESHYSLHRYHIMGSRILSRSFHVEEWEEKVTESDDDRLPEDNTRKSDRMDVDSVEPEPNGEKQEPLLEDEDSDGDDEDEEDDEDDPADVAMVPLADLLNARYQSENAKLHYDSEDLQMICTHDIQAGEQIWNTYGDHPNSDLLRRYGHVDILSMDNGVQGNPADIVEVRADIVVRVLRAQSPSKIDDPFPERIEWWLDEGGDDVFIIETNHELPEALISLIHLLIMPKNEWEKYRDKGKVPKPKPDLVVLRIAEKVLQNRIEGYQTTIEEDEALLVKDSISRFKRMAIVVRLGEKRILKGTLEEITKSLASETKVSKNKKRRSRSDDIGRLSKRGRH